MSIVKIINQLRQLTPEEFKLAVALARPDSLKPGRKRKKPGPKPGTKRAAKAPEADGKSIDKAFPKAKRITQPEANA